MCNTNGVRNCELLEISSKSVWEYIFYDMKLVKYKNRNRMADEILDDSVREASTRGIPLVEICDQLLFAIV